MNDDKIALTAQAAVEIKTPRPVKPGDGAPPSEGTL
jgi:hypothetical protein